MLTVLVPLLLCCIVAHRAESAHQRAQHTVMMDLISTIEVSLAQLKPDLNRVLKSASRSASGVTSHADAPSPPSTIHGDTKAIYTGNGTKTIAEMNTFQLSDAIARNSSNGTKVVLVVTRRSTHRDTTSNARRASVFQCARAPQSQPVNYGFVLRLARVMCTIAYAVPALRLNNIRERTKHDESSAIPTSKAGHSENMPTAAQQPRSMSWIIGFAIFAI
jgi:hypothetical protein